MRTFNVHAEHVEKFERCGWQRAGYKLFADAQVSYLMVCDRTVLIMPCLECGAPVTESEWILREKSCAHCKDGL